MIATRQVKRSPKKKVITDPIVLTRTEPQHPVGLIAVMEKAHCEYDVFYPKGKEAYGVDLPDAPPRGTLARKLSDPSRALVFDGKTWQGR